MASGGQPCKAPSLLVKGALPQKILVREGRYHGSGLLPWSDPYLRVVTAYVFSPTKWCCRKITIRERLLSRDLSKGSLDCLSKTQQWHLVSDANFIPEKCCLGVIDGLMGNNTPCALAVPFEQKQHVTPKLGLDRLVNNPRVCESMLDRRLETKRAFKRTQAATKADDAEVPVELWDARVLPELSSSQRTAILEPLRKFCLQWWRKNVRRSFIRWFRGKYRKFVVNNSLNLKQIYRTKAAWADWVAGRDCVRRCCLASWWDWDAGSRPLHWHWPLEYQQIIRDGLPPWFSTVPPTSTVPQRGKPDPVIRAKVADKLGKVRAKGYLAEGEVKSLTSFFTVPIGDQDIRVVYNGTKSGLNACLWTPWFRLPTIEQHLRAVDAGTYLSDLDVAEQFHNFVMHHDIQPYAGVDVTAFFPNEFVSQSSHKQTRRTIWLRWTRCGVGFKMSPYNAGQAMLHAEEVIRGSHLDPTNPFRFDCVQLNIPGQRDYNPALPRVFKWRLADSKIANDFFVYVDDARTTGGTEEECWACSRAVASRYSFLGLQDASQKRRDPSQEAGPWAGSTVHTSQGCVTVTVTMDRWTKAKSMIHWLHALVVPVSHPIPFKRLESNRGYLVYLSRPYPALVPYLKGIHLTLDSWRPHRDASGWKLSRGSFSPEEDFVFSTTESASAPVFVYPVGQLQDDICALYSLFFA